MGREVYPQLTGREARRRLAEERAAEEAFADAVTRREEASIIRAIGPVFRGSSTAEMARVEQRRVRGLIERDRAGRIEEALRTVAEIEFADGVMVNLADTVVPPTREWMKQNAGAIEAFTPRQPDGTVRTISTVRRMSASVVMRMARKGQLSDDAAKACQRYAATHEAAGLDGNIPSVNYSREVFSAPATRLMFTDAQGEAQSELRAMRAVIPARYRKFFDAVVLRDVPLHRASRFARMRRTAALAHFRELADDVAGVVGAF